MRNETLQLWFDIGCLESYLAAVCFSLVTDKCKKGGGQRMTRVLKHFIWEKSRDYQSWAELRLS